jgi:phosphate acyltransferase
MGGDSPTEELVRGGVEIGRLREIEILFAGDAHRIETALRRLGETTGTLFDILDCPEVISMEEPPVRAVREKPSSSLVRGLRTLREERVDAFVSPGNTGAVVAGALLTLGRIRGIPRPAILAPLPTLPGPDLFLIDVGANTDCHAEHLLHFARMGITYAQELAEASRPTVALLNIGEEQSKGNRLTEAAFSLLEADDHLSFIGNVEAHQILETRPADVIVSDGFVGNICLKAIEGGVSGVTGFLKQAVRRSMATRLGALLMKPAFSSLRRTLSYRERGGAPLLGVNGVVVIAHGRSDARAISTAIDGARREVEARLTERIAGSIPLRVDHHGS